MSNQYEVLGKAPGALPNTSYWFDIIVLPNKHLLHAYHF